MKHISLIALIVGLLPLLALGQEERTNQNPFRQIDDLLPTPNVYRSGSGSPGPEYWQQQADYEMETRLDDTLQRIYGEQTVTYYNNSPETLDYLWLQLDQNVRAQNSDSYKIRTGRIDKNSSLRRLMATENDYDGGFKIEKVETTTGKSLSYTINNTMMRIDPPQPIRAGGKISFRVKWWYNVNDRMKVGGRSGMEYFPENDNYLYTIAQFFPRMCVFDDINGWQNKQFLGRGEFALPFGNYDVKITVPEDHLVAATGTLQNERQVLPAEKRKLLDQARNSYDTTVIIYSEEEAREREQEKQYAEKTWHFTADNVRDFAFASSRKFIWDAMSVKIGDRDVLAMSMYPKEGNPLWERYSTKAVAHTLKWYSHYTIDYPYPVAWSINAARIGMEYPMICFNYGRCEEDGTYTERTKYGMISVIIHEVGHNFFPMIVNSDERQWTWMDEGLNTFTQFLTEQHWEPNYPSRRGPAHKITDYMGGNQKNIAPIMTNSESIPQFGNNAYGKPATALNILRETVMGRELFDFAFKQYAKRWKFKHPSPADFFRTMEDASAVDLDWFWRGWFYTTDYVDIAIENVEAFQLDWPTVEQWIAEEKEERAAQKGITTVRNDTAITETYAERDSALVDFYTQFDPLEWDRENISAYEAAYDKLSNEQKEYLQEKKYFYEVSFQNKGGLVMPIILKLTYEDQSEEIRRIPAEIWKMGHDRISKVFHTEQAVKQFELDPLLETADVDRSNNYYPERQTLNRFELFERKKNRGENNMQRHKRLQEEKE